MRIAVAGASGTAGSAVCEELERRGDEVIRLGRSQGVDLLTGEGLDAALDGCSAAIDCSAIAPADDSTTLEAAHARAARTLARACAEASVGRLVVLSILGIDDPELDAFDYYVAKRAQERAVRDSGVPHVIVRSAQWFEFATNPAAVTVDHEGARAQDWLIQPLPVAAVAEVLADAAHGEVGHPGDAAYVEVAGTLPLRLPELTASYLDAIGDERLVTTVEPALPAFGDGALLPGEGALFRGSEMAEWLRDPPRLPLDG